jgi:hypothetical protein
MELFFHFFAFSLMELTFYADLEYFGTEIEVDWSDVLINYVAR